RLIKRRLQMGETVTKEGYVPSDKTLATGEKSPLDWGGIEYDKTLYVYDGQRIPKDEAHLSKKIKENSPSEARAAAGGEGAEPAEYEYVATLKHYRTEA